MPDVTLDDKRAVGAAIDQIGNPAYLNYDRMENAVDNLKSFMAQDDNESKWHAQFKGSDAIKLFDPATGSSMDLNMSDLDDMLEFIKSELEANGYDRFGRGPNSDYFDSLYDERFQLSEHATQLINILPQEPDINDPQVIHTLDEMRDTLNDVAMDRLSAYSGGSAEAQLVADEVYVQAHQTLNDYVDFLHKNGEIPGIKEHIWKSMGLSISGGFNNNGQNLVELDGPQSENYSEFAGDQKLAEEAARAGIDIDERSYNADDPDHSSPVPSKHELEL